MTECNSCGFTNRSGVRFCEGCGQRFDRPSAQVTCPACGHGNDAAYRFCEECGASFTVLIADTAVAPAPEPTPVRREPVPESRPTTTAAPPAPRTRRWPKVAAAIVVVGIAGGGAWLASQQPWQDDTTNDFAQAKEPPPTPSPAPPETTPQESQSGSTPPDTEAMTRPTTRATTAAPTTISTAETSDSITEITPGDIVIEFEEREPSDLQFAAAGSQGEPPVQAFGLTAPPDSDVDGIADWIEEWVVETFAPIYVFDEHEPSGASQWAFQSGPGFTPTVLSIGGFQLMIPFPPASEHPSNNMAFAWQVSPIPAPNAVSSNPSVAITIVALYRNDWVDLGNSAGGSWWHYGDTERMRIFVDISGPYCDGQVLTPDCLTSGYYNYVRMTLNRHHETAWYEASQLRYLPDSLGRYHLAAFVSEGKHAVYTDYRECEDAKVVGPVHENCDHGHIWQDVDFMMGLNVGEAGSQAINQLAAVPEFASIFGSAGDERAWDPNWRFCGGYNISAADRDRTNDVLSFFGQTSPMCAGPVGNKWYEPHLIGGEWWGSNGLQYVIIQDSEPGWYSWEAYDESGSLVETAWVWVDGLSLQATFDGGDNYVPGSIGSYSADGLGVIYWTNGVVFSRIPDDSYLY